MPLLTPRTTDFITKGTTQIDVAADVDATPQEVWAVLTDNERWPEWFPAAKACRTTSDVKAGVGSTRWIHFGAFKVNERFIAWDEPREWAFTILDANLPGFVSVVERARLEPTANGGTRIRYVLAAAFAPYLRPLTPVLRRRLTAQFRAGLAGMGDQVRKVRAEPD